MDNRIYLCIDLKSFYASVECVERGLDPFKVNLVVADPSRGGGAITLAATPAIKKLGVSSRGRIYEIPKHIEYITSPPRMKLYMTYSANVYRIFLKYISSEDIHVYSIDESFLDITSYLSLYHMNGKELAQMILKDIYQTLGLCATVGIGTNLFLAKVALDITAKHAKDCIGYLDEDLYKQMIWHHRPITDIWMIGRGTEKRLAAYGIVDLYGVAHCDKQLLHRIFGIQSEILYDHAWGKEPTKISDIKAYQPKSNSITNSQILFEDYNYHDAYLVMKEMVESNVLQLVEKHLVTNHISLCIGYSRDIIKPTRGSCKITNTTQSYQVLLEEFKLLYQRIVNREYPIRQIAISFGNLKDECYEQLDLFQDIEAIEKEKRVQEALIKIRHKYGENAVLKGMNLCDKATQRKRNGLVGGHHA